MPAIPRHLRERRRGQGTRERTVTRENNRKSGRVSDDPGDEGR